MVRQRDTKRKKKRAVLARRLRDAARLLGAGTLLAGAAAWGVAQVAPGNSAVRATGTTPAVQGATVVTLWSADSSASDSKQTPAATPNQLRTVFQGGTPPASSGKAPPSPQNSPAGLTAAKEEGGHFASYRVLWTPDAGQPTGASEGAPSLLVPPASSREEAEGQTVVHLFQQGLREGLRLPGEVQPRPGRRLEEALTTNEDILTLQLPLDLPSPEALFRLEGEEALRQRIRQQSRDQWPVQLRTDFPEEVPFTRGGTVSRQIEPQAIFVEPNYVCYRRLSFEQRNSERYGWDLGVIHPLVSSGVFYTDAFLLPYHAAAKLVSPCECSAGYCLPGQPAPLLLYPPKLFPPGSGWGAESGH